MKRVIPFVIVAIMAGLSSWGMSQGFMCFPSRFVWFPSGNRVPVPLTQQQPLEPMFHYPTGIAPTMSNMPLPTRNPAFDVDRSPPRVELPSSPVLPAPAFAPVPTLAPVPNLSNLMPPAQSVIPNLSELTPPAQSVIPNLSELTPPAQSTTLRFQPIPTFSVAAQGVVAGRFDSFSRQHNVPFVTPDAAEDDADDSDPFGSTFDDDEDAPVVAVTPDAKEDDADDSDPFDGAFADEAEEEDAPVVAPTPETSEDQADDSNTFDFDFGENDDDNPFK